MKKVLAPETGLSRSHIVWDTGLEERLDADTQNLHRRGLRSRGFIGLLLLFVLSGGFQVLHNDQSFPDQQGK